MVTRVPPNTVCGVNFFILGSRRVLAPAPKVPGSDITTHLKSRFCLQAILTKRGAMLEFEIDVPNVPSRDTGSIYLTPYKT